MSVALQSLLDVGLVRSTEPEGDGPRYGAIFFEPVAEAAGVLGLDVGARTPAETAIAVLGEILALRAGRSGGRLAEASGPIHPRAAERASTA